MTSFSLPRYAELHCLSNFSFLKGASHPEELVVRAVELGYVGLAITDECSLAGVVRAHGEAKDTGLHLIIGSSFVLDDGLQLVLLATSLDGYGNLSELITLARMRCEKGTYRVTRADLDGNPQSSDDIPASAGTIDHLARMPDCLALWIPSREANEADLESDARWIASTFPNRAWIAIERAYGMDDDLVCNRLMALGERMDLPCVAAGNVHMHVRSRKPLHDTLTAIRLNKPVAECGDALAPNAERHLRSRVRLAELFKNDALLEESVKIAKQCKFSLIELGYQYPKEIVPNGETQTSYLRKLTEEGLITRFPDGVITKVREQVEHELALIADLRYEAFFLTVYDIVKFARSQEILCQGRGSAANSTVCFCLGITEVNPALQETLFERFLTKERNEPPDIDVDFEHQRREEVIQYIYEKYGRHRTALAATVIAYRTRSAVRDVGKALGLEADRVQRLSSSHAWWDGGGAHRERLEENGFDPDSPVVQKLIELTSTLRSFPRHLSQHVGGFVISRDKLSRLVPIENAAMENRSVIQWDKDDLEELGLLKVDVLALGMLSAIRRALDLVAQRRGTPFRMIDVPKEDPFTYDMICKADTVGVFQIESRAQMSMLPRLLPKCFYDLVVEVAIVRPGPIQGGMVHPYLKAHEALRRGEQPLYESPKVEQALSRTLGVPIFQEQVMQLMMLAADFTAGEADKLRRAMAAWKRKGGLGPFHDRIVDGMLKNGYERDYAERIFKQVEGFGEYGFPESHAASFAFLVYISCWLKCHEPAVFLAAMLNSQPLGFYSSSQLIQDARRNDVVVRAIDVMVSDWDATLEECEDFAAFEARRARDEDGISPRAQPAVRLGLNSVKGFNDNAAERLIAARAEHPFRDVDDLARRAALSTLELGALAAADALAGIAGHRRQARWQAASHRLERDLMRDATIDEPSPQLPVATEGREIVDDYASTGFTLRRHPLALLRPRLSRMKLSSAAALRDLPTGRLVRTTGIVTVRQRPGTAKDTIFVTLEDETGVINVIVWKHVVETQRRPLLSARLLTVHGVWQKQGEVRHVIANRLFDHSQLLGRLGVSSRDFH
ncbi:MAG: error-prone DNA polymerase [Burkholderiaceae bacterium]